MAQSFTTTSGTIIVPGVYSNLQVQNTASGLGTNGVIVLVGESDGGPDFTQEADLNLNAFGPDQYAAVQAKYLSGNLVDAFRAAVDASNDQSILGAPSSIILVKTNPSTQATSELLDANSANYAELEDANWGSLGNLIFYNVVTATAEILPTTGLFTFIPNVASLNTDLRVDGGSAQPLTLSTNTLPNTLVSDINGLSGLTATGGVLRTVLPSGSGTVSVTNVSNSLTIGYSATWTTTPSVGDTLQLPIAGALAAASGNSSLAGSYVVTSATNNSVVATKLSDAGSGAGTPGTVTPISIGTAGPISIGATTDIKVWSPITIALSDATLHNGWSKSLQVNNLTSGTDRLSNCLFALNTTKVAWLSSSGTPQLLVSAAENSVTMSVQRQATNTFQSFTVGGEIGLTVGYLGTTATLTITGTTLTTSVTGGAGTSLTVNLLHFPTIADVVAFIGSQSGYTAAVGTVALGQLTTTALDDVTAIGICTDFGGSPGRIKTDGFRFSAAVKATNVVTLAVNPLAGLPGVVGNTFLAGGSLGGTSDAIVAAALVALQSVPCNFVVTLFSQDATLDIAAGLTDPSSTYDINSVNADLRSHCLLMGQFLNRMWRQGLASFRGTFVAARGAAANMASAIMTMNFQDVKLPNSQGQIVQFQPWMGATLAAGMQAAGFYRPIVKKFVNCSGILQAAGDYNDQNVSQKTQALQAGLLPLERAPSGGIRWTSDQTTYGADNNFSFNSLVTTYLNFVQQSTISQQMETRFIGQSSADVSAAIMLSFLDGIMLNLLQLKVISPSDDAPTGYKNASINFVGNAFVVNIETKTSTAVYFGVLNILVTQIQQTATSGQGT